MERKGLIAFFGGLLKLVVVLVGALSLTVTFFLVLPLVQAIAKPPATTAGFTSVDTADVEPPPPIEEDQPEDEEEPEEEPPELMSESEPLSLEQLDLALNATLGDGLLGGDFAVRLDAMTGKQEDLDALFSIGDLDQKPRAIHQPSPAISAKARKKAPGKVYVIFIVDRDGRVMNPKVQTSSDPVFDRPALAAVKSWKFEPGMRNGSPVRFRMRVPITFPKG